VGGAAKGHQPEWSTVAFGGLAGQFFSPAARLLAAAPFVPGFFSRRARNPAVLQRLIDGTGSTLDAAGVELYGRLVSSPGHTAGALGMMANWDLQSLSDDLAQMVTPMSLLAGTHDLTIDPGQARRVLALLPQASGATLTLLPRLGHLAHEERPDLIAQVVLECLQAARQTTIQG